MKISKNWKNSWIYHYFTQVNQTSWSYATLLLRYGAWQINCYIFILGYILPFYPPNLPEKPKFQKTEIITWNIINLTKSHDHMLYCSWDMACDRCNCCFSFWAIFCPFTPLTAQKMKISKKYPPPPPWRYNHFTHVYQKLWLYDYMMYGSWDIVPDRDIDRQTGRWKKWHIEVGAPPKNPWAI